MNDLEDRLTDALDRTAANVRPSAPPTFSWEKPHRARFALKVATPLAAAAAVAVVATVATGNSPSPQHHTANPASPSATVRLTGYLVPGAKTPLRVGQYFYSKTTLSIPDDQRYVVEAWQPADPNAEYTVKSYWLTPSGHVLGKATISSQSCTKPKPVVPPVASTVALCPEFGDWTNPSPEFLRGLPTEPHALYAKLHQYVLADYKKSGADRKLDFSQANIAFLTINYVRAIGSQTAAMSQPFSAALQQATALIPGVRVAPATNLTGVRGTGYSITAGNGNTAGPVIFDADGNYVGAPDSAVSVGAADGPGQAPTQLTH